MSRFRPQVDPSLYHIDFLPVISKNPSLSSDHRIVAILLCFILDLDQHDLCLVRIRVKKGTAPVYFTTSDRFTAFLRRDGGTKRMEPTLIEERLQRAALHANQDHYQYNVFSPHPTLPRPYSKNQSYPSPHFQSSTLSATSAAIIDFIGRKDEIKAILSFLSRFPKQCRVVSIYGGFAMGKSALANELFTMLGGRRPKAGITIDLQGYITSSLSPIEAMRAAVVRRLGGLKALDKRFVGTFS